MIRAVLDTNVLASGVVEFEVAERAPGHLLRLWRDQRFQLVVSPEILSELMGTLAKPYYRRQITPEQFTRFWRLLQDEATEAFVVVRVSGVASHPEDDLILSAAVSAQADYLVTGDKQMQRLEAYQGVRIVSPRQFLILLEQEGM
jgi:putative PIN family toxin of toxin-antitoxin system